MKLGDIKHEGKKVKEKGVCDAHGMMSDMLMNLQQTQQKISDEVSENNVRTAKVEITVDVLTEQFSQYREENERYQTQQTERLDKLYGLLQAEKKRNQFRPAHLVAIISSAIGATGIVLAAWFTRSPK